MTLKLGINTGFALNRFTTPEEWAPLIADTFGLTYVQFTADLLNPSLENSIISAYIKRINRATRRYGLMITSTFTSAFTRLNHLSHPDPLLRAYWKKWFYKWVDISAAIGAREVGSHFGILTMEDLHSPAKRKERFKQTVHAWHDIAAYGAKKGLDGLQWEPMSIAREYGETLSEARRVQKAVNHNIAIPMKLCLDVDHGDVTSKNPDDTDPYAWIRAFAPDITMIHLKQSLRDKGGHWPFTPDKNKKGKIQADKLVRALHQAGIDATLYFEMSFREREPVDSRMVRDIQASVDYWRPYVSLR